MFSCVLKYVMLVYVSVLCLETQKKISWRMWEAKHLMVAVDFNSIFSILRKLMATVKCLVTNILPNIFFVLNRQRNIQVWNNLRPTKWQKLHFWVNYPFKFINLCFWIIVDLWLRPRLAQASNITLQHLKETKGHVFMRFTQIDSYNITQMAIALKSQFPYFPWKT